MVEPTTKQRALYELARVRSKIASNRKTAQNDPSRKNADIADATLPSLIRRERELEELARTLPAEAENKFGVFELPDDGKPYPPTPPLEADGSAGDIPDFLKRSA